MSTEVGVAVVRIGDFPLHQLGSALHDRWRNQQ